MGKNGQNQAKLGKKWGKMCKNGKIGPKWAKLDKLGTKVRENGLK